MSNAVASLPGVARLIAIVGDVFGVQPHDIRGRSRIRRITVPRHIAMGMACHDRGGGSLPFVGRRFGRDHTTVLHAKRRYLRWCDELGVAPGFEDARERAALLAVHLGVEPRPAPPELPAEAEPPVEPPPPAETAPPLSKPSPAVKAAAPAVTVSPPAPEPAMPRLSEPPADAFGRIPIDPIAFAALPPAMQGEGLRLGLEYMAETHPKLGTADRLARIARGLGLEFRTAEMLANGHHLPHRLPGELANGHSEKDAGTFLFEAPRRCDTAPSSGHFDAFASTAIRPAPKAALVVPDAYQAYRAWCGRTRESVMPRASFGAALLQRARGAGGGREGDIITGLELVSK